MLISQISRIPSLENYIKTIIRKNLSLVALMPGTEQIIGLVIVDEKVFDILIAARNEYILKENCNTIMLINV